MIRHAREGDIVWFDDLRSEDLPHSLHRGIRVHLRGLNIGIEAQGVVGSMALLNGDTLQIAPKIGQINFLRLLFRAEGSQQDLTREYEHFVHYSLDREPNVTSVVAKSLYHAFSIILRRGLQTDRKSVHRVGTFAAGKMDIAATALRIARRQQEPVVYMAKDRSSDTPEHRVLREALLRAWPMLDVYDQKRLGSILDRCLSMMPRSPHLEADLRNVEEGFASGRYGGARDYYRHALMLAQVVLGSSGLGFGEAAVVEGDAVLLNSADVFERYIRNVVREAYSASGYVVAKGGAGSRTLYTDGSYELHPDIVISHDGAIAVIADAKYKNPTASDHYQLHAYLIANKLTRGLILAPNFDGGDVQVKEHVTDQGVVVREVFLPMRDLMATEAFLRNVLIQAD